MTSTIRRDLDLSTLSAIERRVLWLAVRIVDYANRERPRSDGPKVGGHQASSASMVTLMTALYLADLRAEDRVSVKPHASPVLHAIEYLLGRLDRSYLTRLRDFGGLQSYPSRTKDPYPVDYSTGSVGLGSAAPLFGALADRFTKTRLGASTGGRFISLLGDAELDEGNIWEALADPLTRRLGNVLWLVDLNRQSLDRVIPGIRAAEACGRSHSGSTGSVRLAVRPKSTPSTASTRPRSPPPHSLRSSHLPTEPEQPLPPERKARVARRSPTVGRRPFRLVPRCGVTVRSSYEHRRLERARP